MVAAFSLAWLTAEETTRLHEIAGYAVAALVAFRVIWGAVGPHYARFSQFVTGPRAFFDYVRDMARGRDRRYLGHNPAGAAMIVALLLSLFGTAFSGWLMAEPTRLAMLPETPQLVSPAWADDEGEELRAFGEGDEDALENIDEAFANLVLFLVALHVIGGGNGYDP